MLNKRFVKHGIVAVAAFCRHNLSAVALFYQIIRKIKFFCGNILPDGDTKIITNYPVYV